MGDYSEHCKLFDALVLDNVGAVKSVLETGVDLQEFLTIERLERLYDTKKGPQNTLKYILPKYQGSKSIGNKPSIMLPDIGTLIESLMGGVYQSTYTTRSFKTMYRAQLSGRPQEYQLVARQETAVTHYDQSDQFKFKSPYGELYKWAVLTRRNKVARMAWEHGEDALAKAIVGSKMFDSLAMEAANVDVELEVYQELMDKALEYRKLAVALLDTCYHSSDAKTLQLLTAELTEWGEQTCISLAAMSSHREFVGHPCCQILLADLWQGALDSRKHTDTKVICGLVCPVVIGCMQFKTHVQLQNQAQSAAAQDSPIRTTAQEVSVVISNSDDQSELESASPNMNDTVKASGGPPPVHDNEQSLSRITRCRLAQLRSGQCSLLQSYQHKPLSLFRKHQEFHTAPITKYWSYSISYVCFLLALTYMCLVRVPRVPNVVEWTCVGYVANVALNYGTRLLCAEPKSLRKKVVVFFGNFWNSLIVLACIMFLCAFGLRFVDEYVGKARVLYAVSSVIWWFRLLQFMAVHNRLGPYITMIGKMVVQVFFILMIMSVVLISFGLARQSISYPTEDWHWSLVRNILYEPYFMLYGDFESDIDGCGAKNEKCVEGRWLVIVLTAAFLIVANLLLISLLIAVFNSVYCRLENLTQQIWKFNRYAQVMHYERLHFLPPPFTFICHLWHWYNSIRRCVFNNNRKHPRSQALKLFLSEEQTKSLNAFESLCMHDLARKLYNDNENSTEERLRLTLEKIVAIETSLSTLINICQTNTDMLESVLPELLQKRCEITKLKRGGEGSVSDPISSRHSTDPDQVPAGGVSSVRLAQELPKQTTTECNDIVSTTASVSAKSSTQLQ